MLKRWRSQNDQHDIPFSLGDVTRELRGSGTVSRFAECYVGKRYIASHTHRVCDYGKRSEVEVD